MACGFRRSEHVSPRAFELRFESGSRYSGICLEDERIWGDTEWGIGYLSGADMPPDGIDAKSHVDGLCPRSSIWVDGEKILDAGDYVQPELARLSLILLGKSL